MKKAVNNCIAQAMGLAAATVARYNELAQKGVDEDYGKEAYRLRPITQAPFYGSFFSGNYPEFFVGVAVGRTMTQGRLAVKAILENA